MPFKEHKECGWILVADPKGYEFSTHCRQPVKYHLEKDDDMNPRRVYDPYCPMHMAKAEAQKEQDEED